jgi:hypothetical protein
MDYTFIEFASHSSTSRSTKSPTLVLSNTQLFCVINSTNLTKGSREHVSEICSTSQAKALYFRLFSGNEIASLSNTLQQGGVDKRRTDGGRRTADSGAFYKHMITTATNYNTLN